MNKPFRLRKFSVQQDHAPMKVNTDALLLGGWISGLALSDCLRILDVGTGTGIIALMLAQAYPEATVHALDISPEALMDARVNFVQSTYADRLEVQQQDFLLYDSDEKYNLIVSNPPYFKADAIVSPEHGRRLARTESADGMDLESFMHRASSLLSSHGFLALITPVDRLDDLRHIATQTCLRLVEHLAVHSSPNVPVRSLTLWQPISLGESLKRTTLSSTCIMMQSRESHVLYKSLLAEYLL